MWKLDSFKSLFSKPPASNVSGVTILLLQKRLERFSTEQLMLAMKRGWRREHDPVTFFATSLDGEGAVIKFNAMFITRQHCDRRIDGRQLGNQSLPAWADHAAHSSLTYACPEGIPVGETRDTFYGFLGLFCAELLSENVSALLFTEEQVLLRNSPMLKGKLQSGNKVNPLLLSAAPSSWQRGTPLSPKTDSGNLPAIDRMPEQLTENVTF